MRGWHPKGRALAAVLTAGLLLAAAGVSCRDDDPPTLRLFDGGWESLQLNNAIVAFVLTHGYDYEVELVPGSTRELLEMLPAGEIDLTLEGWQQNAVAWYELETAAGRIENLGPTYDAGRQFFIVPRWLADDLGIASVFDLRKHWDLFADPRDGSKGVIISCVAGSRCAELNRAKLEAYRLDRHFNLLTPASYESLEATLERAMVMRLPVVGSYWSPGSLLAGGEWLILREPAYSVACQRGLEAAAAGGERLTEGCGYPLASIDAMARAGLVEQAPEAVELVRRMNLGVDELSETLLWAHTRGVHDDWERAAIHYLARHGERWREWVTPAAYERVQAALSNLDAGAG